MAAAPRDAEARCLLLRHLDAIVAYCRHCVRFGVVEAVNTTIKAVPRRARGMRDERLLVLKLRWTTTNPIGTATDLARFPHQGMHSNR